MTSLKETFLWDITFPQLSGFNLLSYSSPLWVKNKKPISRRIDELITAMESSMVNLGWPALFLFNLTVNCLKCQPPAEKVAYKSSK